jgi:hypothetical protein
MIDNIYFLSEYGAAAFGATSISLGLPDPVACFAAKKTLFSGIASRPYPKMLSGNPTEQGSLEHLLQAGLERMLQPTRNSQTGS